MYISAFHINGFGIFNNVEGYGLLPGINIFFGKNEAGKSTCLEFFRAMLTGYPEKAKAGRRSFEPLNGGRPGGSLTLQWKMGEMRLARAPAAYGGLRLNTVDGATLHADQLGMLMGGIDREAYRRVFGFSLDELEKWDKKDNESIRNALYGASFGPGLASPAEAMETINKEMGKIFKARGSSQRLSADLAELDKLRSRIRDLRKDYGEYDSLASEYETQQRLQAEAAAAREKLDLERMRLERLQGVRRQWEQWRLAAMKLEKLPEAPAGFPEDAQTRLARLQADKAACDRDVAEARERLRLLAANVEAIQIDAILLGELMPLRRLSERKDSYRKALKQAPVLQETCERAESSLAANLAQLGPGWSCERIRNTDRSIFTREGMEKSASELNEARMSHHAALAALSTVNGEVDAAQAAVGRAEEYYNSQPECEAPLSENERDSLRAAMARLEESRRLEPRRKQALENAAQSFNRALEKVQVFGDGQDGERILDCLLQQREEALNAAAEIRDSLGEMREAEAKAASAQGDMEDLKRKYDELQASACKASGTTRDALDARGAALRSLRGLAASMAAEEERKKELETRIAQSKTISSFKNWSLIIVGAIFIAAAVGIFAAHWYWRIQEFNFGGNMILPINTWAAYAALFCGVALMGGGFSAYGPEQKRQRLELASLLSRSEASSMHLAELATQSRQLCEKAGVSDLDPIALDAQEMLLEREKEQLFQDEHSARELDALREQMEKIGAKTMRLEQEVQQKSGAAQQARRRWHAFMQSLGIENVPAPEHAATLFARAEAAKMAFETVKNAQRELDAFWEDLHIIEDSITSMPAVASVFANSAQPVSLEQAVAQLLSTCREADAAREMRLRGEADLAGARKELERAVKRQGVAYAQLEEQAGKLALARHNWSRCLDALGMATELDPETVRAAYKCMDECLSVEETLQRSQRELAQLQTEIGEFENPLMRCLNKLKQEARIDAESKPDWLATLDRLLGEAEEQARQNSRANDLRQAVQAQKDLLKAKEAAQKEASEAEKQLLEQGGCANADEFLRLAALRDQRRQQAARVEELEAIVAQAAGEQDLAALLESFKNESSETLEKRLLAIKTDIASLTAKERESLAKSGALQTRLEMLANTNELAEARQREDALIESIRRDADRWAALALAKSLLLKARAIFEKERQPQIIKLASEIFNKITEGRWRGLSLNLEDSRLMVLPEHGEPVEPYNLSRGAQEQAYLAFRMAYIREHAQKQEALPVIMDEILVNFDPQRAHATADALARLAGDGKQQILYFTCHPHMVDLLKDAAASANLFHVENGDIKAA